MTRGRIVRCLLVGSALLGSGTPAIDAQSRYTTNTLTRDDPAGLAPRGTLQDAAWLVGRWETRALGGQVEEVWMSPAGGALPGVFRLWNSEGVVFYELFSLVEEDETLTLKLRHFNADLTGWEERNETVDFPLVKVAPDALYFEGLTYRRVSANEMHVWVVAEQEDGSMGELEFLYRRASGPGFD